MKPEYVLLAFVVVSVTGAQSDDASRTLQDFDSNNDGRITVDEIEQKCRHLDVNGDGVVNYGEFTHFEAGADRDRNDMARFMFYDKLGGDADHQITCTDHSAVLFSMVDADGDGEIVLEELRSYLSKIEDQMRQELLKLGPVGK